MTRCQGYGLLATDGQTGEQEGPGERADPAAGTGPGTDGIDGAD